MSTVSVEYAGSRSEGISRVSDPVARLTSNAKASLTGVTISALVSAVKYLGTWNYLGWLDIASWLAFIVFAVTAFKQFTYRWLRVIAALLVFFLLPFASAALFVRTTSRVVTIDWMLVWLSAELIGIGAIKVAIAALIYGWSVRRGLPGAQFAGS
jgi:hypothetical protein